MWSVNIKIWNAKRGKKSSAKENITSKKICQIKVEKINHKKNLENKYI